MDIKILAADSLGVRSLCCFVTTKNRKILIDPGVALDRGRHGLLPHPYQIAVAQRMRMEIIDAWPEATDIVISHFHGDHTPLVKADPYQIPFESVKDANLQARIWTKNLKHLTRLEKERASLLVDAMTNELIEAEGKRDGPISFSKYMYHGKPGKGFKTVMMTRIEDESLFVHASDIQLLNDEAIAQLLEWNPDVVLVSGPPLYLSNKISKGEIERAWHRAKGLADVVDTLIIDHHIMRSREGEEWLDRLSSEVDAEVVCAADFMHKPRLLLEADRKRLYEEMPVSPPAT